MPIRRFIIRLPFFFGAAILILLIAKLPGVTSLFIPFDCTRCTIGAPLITWIGGGYFSGLLAFMYLAPQFFSRPIASIGVLYAIVLGTLLLWLSPAFCYICFFSHLLHVSMWGYFLVYPQHGIVLIAPFFRQFLCAVQIGLLGTLAYYGIDEGLFKLEHKEHRSILQFAFTTLEGETLNSDALNPYRYVILQFVLPSCEYCEKQLPVLDDIRQRWQRKDVGFFNIVEQRDHEPIRDLRTAIQSVSPHISLVVDEGFSLGKRFDIRTFPTLIVLDSKAHVVRVVVGTYSRLEEELAQAISE